MAGKFNQVLTALAVSFGTLMMGILSVWPSYTSSIYLAPNNTILQEPMSEIEISLVGSLPSLGGMFGTAVAVLLVDKLGRKNGGIALVLPYVISWTVILVAPYTIPILIARFFGGASGGAVLFLAPLFISETAEDSIRGALASGPIIMYCTGALTSYLMGWFTNYHTIIWLNIVFGILNIALLMMVCESPVFFMKKNKEEEARKAISHYRGVPPNSKAVSDELSILKQKLVPASELIAVKTFEQDNEKGLKKTGDYIKQSPIVVLWSSPASRRAFFVVTFLGFAMVFMGIGPVQIHAGSLFSVAAPNLSSHFCSALLALTMLSGSLVVGALSDVFGRRILQITSTVLVSLIMGTLGYLVWSRAAPAWVPAVLLLLYCFCFNIGIGTVPFILIAEVFVPEVQGIASMFFIELMWFLSFVLVTIFPIISGVIGVHGTFFIFSFVGALCSVVTYFVVPETKGLSNDQIQDAFLRKKISDIK